MKRIIDLSLAVLSLLASLPLQLVIGLLLLLATRRPVLFRQLRPGLRGRPFMLVKFATMRPGTESDAIRLTRIGRFLRRLSLDELPTLWNVVRGEMSLVGPRPLRMEYIDRYSPEQARRHNVKPGITGWAQVNGRNAISWDSKLALDVWYVDHRSLGLDLRILLLTIWKVASGQGISQPGQATAEEFKGS